MKRGLIETNAPYYKYTPHTILENERYNLYWDRTISNNRPDITLTDKVKKTFLIDSDHRSQLKYNEKEDKYKDLAREIKQIRRQEEVTVIPIIITASGLIPKGLAKDLAKIEADKKIVHRMQKSVLLDACHIMREFLDQWYSTFFPPVPLETLLHSTLYPQSCWCKISFLSRVGNARNRKQYKFALERNFILYF
jgi:hypothetical protein